MVNFRSGGQEKNITFEDDPPELPKRVMHRKTRWMIFFMKHDEQ